MFLFIIKWCLYLVFHRLEIQIASGAFLVKKTSRYVHADIYRFKFLLRGSAILYSEFIFFRCSEPYPFLNDRAFQNSNCSERRSFQIMRFWQMISKWLGIAYRDWCGNKMGWIWCFQSLNLKFHKKYCQFHVQQPITSRLSSHSHAIWHHLKAKSFLKRWV
jgi:hypothetical protein